MYQILSVFIGSGLGALLRWLVCAKIATYWGTMLVNIAGAFLIGCAYEFFRQKISLSHPEIKLFVMTGFLGGFTTFSTYLLDFSKLLNSQNYIEAWGYLLFSVIIGLTALILGIKLTNIVL